MCAKEGERLYAIQRMHRRVGTYAQTIRQFSAAIARIGCDPNHASGLSGRYVTVVVAML